MSHIADHLLHLRGWVALAVVFAVPALESSAFLGFVFPGEIAVLLGGVLAYQHRVSLPAAVAAAIAGAIIGDSVGYEVGKRWGRTMLHGTVGRLVKRKHLDRAERYLAERGGKAVFVGRFTAALRVLIPGMSGMSGMPYRTFAGYNVAGGTLWAGGFVLLGYAAGDGYRRVEHIAKQASVILLLVVVLVGAAGYGSRQVIKHRKGIEALGRRQLARPWVARLRERYRDQMDFLVRRFRPGGAIGLGLTVSLLAVALAGWAFGWVLTQLLPKGRLLGIDQPVLDFFVRHRTPDLTAVVQVVTFLGSTGFIVPAALVVGGLARWRFRTWRPLAVLAAAYAGASVLQLVVKSLVGRARPPAGSAVRYYSGLAFPSGHATQAAAFWWALALVVAMLSPSWRHRVIAWTVAIVVTALVGLSRCYLGAHWASDVIGGWALGAAWLFAVAAVNRATAGAGEPTASGRPEEPAEPGEPPAERAEPAAGAGAGANRGATQVRERSPGRLAHDSFGRAPGGRPEEPDPLRLPYPGGLTQGT